MHLRKLKKEDVIEDVNPAEPIDCILNVAISEKKPRGTIRMNIDARPVNKGAKHSKYHLTTPQEARHTSSKVPRSSLNLIQGTVFISSFTAFSNLS